MLHGEEIIKYFDTNYNGNDKEKQIELFALYVLFKNAIDIIYNYDLCDTIDELYELLNNNHYFEDILYIINFIQERKLLNDEQSEPDLAFLDANNKYKIMFTGFSDKDVRKLEKNVKKAFINKLSGQLSQSDIITLTESIEHVKETYDFPIFRIQFANDYRIAFVRKNNITAILGVTIKTGKDIDYTRYDVLAKKANEIYNEIELFSKNSLPSDSQHYQVVEYLSTFHKNLK